MTFSNCLMAVHAHPDDEVFSTGGILAKYADAGYRVVVVYCTRGEVGEIHHPELEPNEARERLGEIREQEARAACALLGVTDVYFLGYRDSGMVDTEDNKHPAAFANAKLDEATNKLLAIIRETRAQVLVTYNENGSYGHPDHVMANRITTEAFQRALSEPWAPAKLYYAAASREAFRQYVDGLARLNLKIPWMEGREDFDFEAYGLPEKEITAHINIGKWGPLKKRALAVHRTQIKPDSFYLSIPDEAFRYLANIEYFQHILPIPRMGEYEDDLFVGVPRGQMTTASLAASAGG
jgi:LmbE family N-acetylglucosaminyl deacetylase